MYGPTLPLNIRVFAVWAVMNDIPVDILLIVPVLLCPTEPQFLLLLSVDNLWPGLL